jgi:ketosteroid isomerase-like protein
LVSQQNAELVRAGYELWNRGDVEGFLEFLDPDVEVRDPPESPDAQVWHGHEGYRRSVEQFMAAWEHASMEPEEIIDAGDKVLARVRYHARAKDQGIELELDVFHVVTIREGKAILIEVYGDEAKARRVAGL